MNLRKRLQEALTEAAEDSNSLAQELAENEEGVYTDEDVERCRKQGDEYLKLRSELNEPTQIFVVHYADAFASVGLYEDEDAIERMGKLLEPEDAELYRSAARVAKENPGDPVDLGDGDQLYYLTVSR